MKYFENAIELGLIAALITVAIIGGVVSLNAAEPNAERSIAEIAVEAANESGLLE